MKAFLLAAGFGTRLRPVTDTIPKCLVPINGKPLLEIWLDLLRRNGVDKILINLHVHADAVRQFLAGRFPHLQVTLAPEPQLLGSAGTLAANRDWVRDEPNFWVLYADVLTNTNLSKMQQFHEAHSSAATLGLYRVPDPSRCGIAIVDQSGRIESFLEKPQEPPGNLAFTGILIGTQALLEAIPTERPADIGFHLLPRLAGRMFAYSIDEFLLDIGTLANYEQAQLTWPGL